MKKTAIIPLAALILLVSVAVPALASEAEQGGKQGGIFDVEPGLMIWAVINFLALLLVLWLFAWRPIAAMLVKRTESIEGKIKDAENMRKAAEEKKAEWDRVLKTADAKSAEIMQEGRAVAESQRTDIIAAAKTSAEAERERARRDAGLLKEKAYQDFARDAAEITTALAGKIAKKALSPEDHKKLVEDFLKDYEAAGEIK
jgi:F-type H+-transporting ATPase subunit b